jgi:hypothetical protein
MMHVFRSTSDNKLSDTQGLEGLKPWAARGATPHRHQLLTSGLLDNSAASNIADLCL